MKSKRLFIGIPVENEAAYQLERLQFKWKKSLELPPEGLLSKSDFHLTLHFLGAVQEEHVASWEDSLKQYARLKSFSFALTRFLAFPNLSRPRVITVAGLVGNSPLSHLFYQMAETVESRGVEVEKRVFIPHVTLFRGSGITIDQPLEVANPIEVPITNFALYESLPGNGENRYQILKQFALS
jgi:2'-5' RNA ligase